MFVEGEYLPAGLQLLQVHTQHFGDLLFIHLDEHGDVVDLLLQVFESLPLLQVLLLLLDDCTVDLQVLLLEGLDAGEDVILLLALVLQHGLDQIDFVHGSRD